MIIVSEFELRSCWNASLIFQRNGLSMELSDSCFWEFQNQSPFIEIVLRFFNFNLRKRSFSLQIEYKFVGLGILFSIVDNC
jgi:hypothetical protein